jgi:1,4-dihydroxy-2-naphthoate octaprenyltransferase
MTKLRIWLLAIRPKTLSASIAPVLIGGLFADTLNLFLFSLTLITAMAIQVGTNLANDYFDCLKGADTSERKGPVRVTQAGLVSPEMMRNAIVLTFALAAGTGLFLAYEGGIVITGLLLLSITLGILYTAGPFPLAYIGLGDLFVLLFFGPIATAGTCYLQTHQFSYQAALAGMGLGMLSCAILTVNNLRDIEEDRKAHKKTLCVRYGALFGKMEYLFMLIGAAAIPLFFMNQHPLTLLASLILIPAFPLIRTVFTDGRPEVINLLLPKTSILLILYTLLFCIGWKG